MSFTPGFVPDAKSQWQELDFELQELVLDEMERVALSPPPAVGKVIEHDIAHDRAGIRHYIFMRSIVDRRAGTVHVIGIKHFAKASPGRT